MTADTATSRLRPALSPDDPRRLIPVKEAGRIVGKSPKTLRRLWLAGVVPGRELGRGLLVNRAWIEDFIAWPAEEAS